MLLSTLTRVHLVVVDKEGAMSYPEAIVACVAIICVTVFLTTMIYMSLK